MDYNPKQLGIVRVHQWDFFFYRRSTIGTTIAAIETNSDTYFLQKQKEKFLLIIVNVGKKFLRITLQ